MNPKLHLLNHSGFLLALENIILVFDFYTDPANVLAEYAAGSKPVLFFVSHDHGDHWNPEILSFKNRTSASFYILDSTCDGDTVRRAAADDRRKVFIVEPGARLQEELSIIPDLLRVYVFDSTDEGSAFLIVTEEGSVVHLGDLNDWDWQDEDSEQMEADYKAELARMRDTWTQVAQDETLPEKARHLLLSFVPVDKRLENMTLKGALTFLDYMQPHYLVPMHLSGGINLPRDLSFALAQQGRDDVTQVLELTQPGQKVEIQY